MMDEVFPWDFIDIGVTKKFLRKEWDKAMKGDSNTELQNAVFRLWCRKMGRRCLC